MVTPTTHDHDHDDDLDYFAATVDHDQHHDGAGRHEHDGADPDDVHHLAGPDGHNEYHDEHDGTADPVDAAGHPLTPRRTRRGWRR